ncbi:MAG: ribonuclease HII [Bacteroidales bacterium]
MLAPFLKKHELEAGCDEAGRGCLAGPVFAAAVILPHSFIHPLLHDSKQVNKCYHKDLVLYIEQNATAFAVASVSNEKIDKINILQASFLAMHRAIDQLKIQPSSLLIDGNRFLTYHNIPHTCIVKGDAKFASIAASSILAKYYRDEFMNRIHAEFPMYNWRKNKGYPTSAHRNAIKIYKACKYHRQTFNLLGNTQASLF